MTSILHNIQCDAKQNCDQINWKFARNQIAHPSLLYAQVGQRILWYDRGEIHRIDVHALLARFKNNFSIPGEIPAWSRNVIRYGGL